MREVSTRLRHTFARRADALRGSAALVSPPDPSAGLDDAHAAAERRAFEACAEPCRAPAPALHPLCLCPAPSDPMPARPALQPHQVGSTSNACPAHLQHSLVLVDARAPGGTGPGPRPPSVFSVDRTHTSGPGYPSTHGTTHPAAFTAVDTLRRQADAIQAQLHALMAANESERLSLIAETVPAIALVE